MNDSDTAMPPTVRKQLDTMAIGHDDDLLLMAVATPGSHKPREQGAERAIAAFPTAYVAVIDAPHTLPLAIGFINSALPGWPNNEDSVRCHAHALGYDLARLLVYSTSTVDDPITRLLNTARDYDAAAIITPALEHIGGDPAPIRAVCDLETIYPATTYAHT
ncbi:hypothetical protein [Nocardia terpenica]|uniref:Uncharacterized protein n=1 Tax=Nocardia terpenica TaxID=455432 RepID=A0A164HCC1_9NOCA|nr:hypothetical protein [Nocardia terpenica]KZM68389.1 hypothetical protein AWN90_10910 [Nocardia terpenica]NQE88690.1 hypothetical protein [Nocardia terpenica]